jgi:hypothetical protein
VHLPDTHAHIPAQALILDEAHRLKSRTSATRAALLELHVRWLLLLSGTPVQNNMSELQVWVVCVRLCVRVCVCVCVWGAGADTQRGMVMATLVPAVWSALHRAPHRAAAPP